MYDYPLPPIVYQHPQLPPSSKYYLDMVTTEVDSVPQITITAFIICTGGEVGVIAIYPDGGRGTTTTHSFPEHHTLECQEMVWLDPPLKFIPLDNS